MKKLIAILTALLLVAAMAGCGTSERAQEKAAEEALEEAIGGDVNVDIDGDKYIYEDEEGNKIEIGGNEWSSSDVAKLIPKFDKGTVVSVVDMEDGCIIDIDDVEKSDFEDYLQKVKNAGFTHDSYVVTDENGTMYMASAENGDSVILGYSVNESHLQISISDAE